LNLRESNLILWGVSACIGVWHLLLILLLRMVDLLWFGGVVSAEWWEKTHEPRCAKVMCDGVARARIGNKEKSVSNDSRNIYQLKRQNGSQDLHVRKKSFLLVSVVAGVKRKRTYTACWGWQKKCVVAVATLTHSLTLSLLWMSPSHSLSVISFPELHPRSLSPTREIIFISH